MKPVSSCSTISPSFCGWSYSVISVSCIETGSLTLSCEDWGSDILARPSTERISRPTLNVPLQIMTPLAGWFESHRCQHIPAAMLTDYHSPYPCLNFRPPSIWLPSLLNDMCPEISTSLTKSEGFHHCHCH